MRYYVLSDDGQKYGPADVPTLNQWIAENRLLPSQMLEEEGSGARLAARAVPGLNFPESPQPGSTAGAAPGQPHQGYYRPPGGVSAGDDGSRDITPAWVLFGVGLISCCCVPYVKFLIPAAGVYFANRARQKGHPQGTTVFVLNLIVLILSILLVILSFVMRDSMMQWAEQMQRSGAAGRTR